MGEKEQQDEEDMLPEERRFAQKERQYYKSEFCTRLPFKSYHRMARDAFVYPEDMPSVPSNERDIDLFKKYAFPDAESTLNSRSLWLERR